jgi:flagellar biosynthesis protein FliQ
MDSEFVLYIGRRALETALLVSAPVLAVALAIGVGTAMLQAVTSIRDMTLGLVLKLVGVGVTLLICGGWMLDIATRFATEIFNHAQSIGLGH